MEKVDSIIVCLADQIKKYFLDAIDFTIKSEKIHIDLTKTFFTDRAWFEKLKSK